MSPADQLKELEIRYSEIFERNLAVKLLIDPSTGAVVDANSAAAAFYGYTVETLRSMNIADINLLDKEAVNVEMESARRMHRNHFRFQHRLADGSIRDVEVHSSPVSVDGKTLLFSIIHDVTEKATAVEQARAYASQVQAIMESSQDIVFALDREFKYLAFNKNHWNAMHAIYGVDLKVGENILQYMRVHGDDEKARKDIQRALNGEHFVIEQIYGDEKRQRTFFEASYNPIRSASGEVTGVAVFVRDITDRRQYEEAIEQSEKKYRSIFENIAEGIYQATEDGVFLTVNPALVRMLGYESIDEVMELNLNRDIFARESDRLSLNVKTRQQGVAVYTEVDWKARDGSIFQVRLKDRAVYDENGKFVYFEVTVEDVSERRRLEQQLIQAQKIESIGRIAGGVAHDMNNMLAVILPTAEMLSFSADDPAAVKSHAELISNTAKRASEIVKQLLVFARQSPVRMTAVDVHQVVRETCSMMRHVLGPNITIDLRLDPKPCMTEADATQLQQVLINLLVNARDAIGIRGIIRISVEPVEMTPEMGKSHGDLRPGSYIRMKVSDNGSGIAPEVLPFIFEAFYSTKKIGQGTGLGLAVVKSIVMKHNGHIEVVSENAHGSTFTLYLPVPQGYAWNQEPSVSSEYEHGHESILVVDDETDIRVMLERLLGDLGYRVTTASNGDEAIELFRKGPTDVVLLDIQMPGRDGRAVFHELQKISPNLRGVYMSGYAKPEIIQAIEESSEAIFMEKPFTIQDLSRVIREALR